MLTPEITLVAAFFGGVLSFLSPCVLPLVPAYISFMTGMSIEDLQQGQRSAAVLKKTIITSLAFILGFSVIFVLLGASATTLGKMLDANRYQISRIAGVIVIIFGLYFLGLFRKPLQFLNYEKRFHVKHVRAGMLGAFLLGLAFAFGWMPCYGPLLAAIISLAGAQQTVWQGIGLLSLYSLGLGLPFLLTAIAMQRCLNLFKTVKQHFHLIEIISGVFLILMGLLLLIGKFTIIAEWFSLLFI